MVKRFLLNCSLEKWLHQNRAVYTGDFLDGCLLDNFVVWTNRGVAAVYEHYLNANSSCYEIAFQAGDGAAVWEEWRDFENRYREEAATC